MRRVEHAHLNEPAVKESGQASRTPPVIVLGGTANALSVARRLGARRIPVYALNYPREAVRYSRHCRFIELDDDGGPRAWAAFLLSPRSEWLRGAILLACSDEAIALVVDHAEALARKFVLEEGEVALRGCLLDKLCTYRLAREVGIPTPAFWPAATAHELETAIGECRFPVLVKPLLSPAFTRAYDRKYILAEDAAALREVHAEASRRQFAVLVMEFIPGDDDLSVSYNAYLDDHGRVLAGLTTQIIRRYPMNMGPACHEIVDCDPEVAAQGLLLLRAIALRGIGCIDFKRDPRDGVLKLIEINARFIGPDRLLVAAGVDFASLSYDRLTGRPVSPAPAHKAGLRQWLPKKELFALRERRAARMITIVDWAASLLHWPHLPYFSWRDPAPAIVLGARSLHRFVGNRTRRLFSAP